MVRPLIVIRPRAFVLALLGAALSSQVPLTAQSLGSLARQNATRGMLWKIESSAPEGGVLYLAGSVHALGRTAYPLATAYDQAFDAATTLVEELDPDQMAQPDTAAAMLAKARLKPGKTLEQVVSPHTYEKFTEFLAATGLPAARVSELKPWAIAVMISALVATQIGLDPALGLDRHFFDRAKTRKMAFIGLETALEQLDRLDSLPATVQDHMLTEALTRPDAAAKQLTDMVTAWRRGDATAIETMVTGEFASASDAYQSLLVARNRNWMPTMEKCLAGLRCFVVVGAAHLVGPDGLVALLTAKGYRATQM